MNPRWIIPLSLAVFAVVAAALWGWLSHTQEQVVLERVMLDELSAISLASRPTDRATDPQTSQQPASPAARRPAPTPAMLTPAPRRIDWGHLADQLDEQSVFLRLRAQDASYVRCATGWTHLDADRPLAALHEFDRLLKRHADEPAALAGRADALCRLRRFDEAVDPYTKLTALRPDDAVARFNFGALLYRLSRFTEASAQFRELVSLQPDHARGWYNLAGLAQRAGRLTEARDAWRQFARLEPNIADGWFNLGLVLLDLEDPIEALFCFACGTAVNPDDFHMRINLAATFDLLGDRAAACEIVHELHDQHPCDEQVAEWLAAFESPDERLTPPLDGPEADPAPPRQTAAALHTDEDRR